MYEVTSGRWYSGVSIDEALRYSGVKSVSACGDELISEAVRALNQVGEAARPKCISRECSLSLEGDKCVIDGFEIISSSLARHLAGCDKTILFAATLGSGVDMLIGRFSAVRMSYALFLQGAAAALIEYFCDCECAKLEETYKKSGYFLLPRFSPGYGDFSLDSQHLFIDYLGAYRYAGISVSGGGQMTPMKSVTAVLGLSRTERSSGGSCASGKCLRCKNVDCVFRRV